ncbi:MAG: hypothetical protein ACYCS1_05260 [Gammaproteobacteria bacterium]
MNSARKHRRKIYRELATWLSHRTTDAKQNMRYSRSYGSVYFLIGDNQIHHFNIVEKSIAYRKMLIQIDEIAKNQDNKEILKLLKNFKIDEIADMLSEPMQL